VSGINIKSNLFALKAISAINRADQGVERATTRLSSGLRINSGGDDPAALALASKLKSDQLILTQGLRNLGDGIGLLNVAESALSELSNITSRLAELANQSASGTVSNRQRLALEKEADLLALEYNRIARTTTFNGRNLFDASFGELSLQVGPTGNDSIRSSLGGSIGTGNFGTGTSYSFASPVQDFEAVDLNGDGHLDMVVAAPGSSVFVRLNNGQGTFGAITTLAGTVGTPFEVSFGDINNDGKVDLVTTGGGINIISTFLGNGDGTFATAITTSAVSPVGLSLADFNGDGKLDAVTRTAPGSLAQIRFGNGDGTFQTANDITVPNTATSIGYVNTGDFNRDGFADIAVNNSSAGSVTILLNNRDGTFSPSATISGLGAPVLVEIRDLNQDGFDDVITSNGNFNTTGITLGNGDGTFQPSLTINLGTGTFASGIGVGDFDGDGRLDIAIGEATTDTVRILNGASNYSATQTVTGFTAVNFVKAADVSGDGIMDLLVGDGASVQVRLGESTTGIGALQDFSLRSADESRLASAYLAKVQERLATQQGTIGAFRARVESAERLSQVQIGNLAEAHSRIVDADVAEEVANLVAQQILRQMATAVLAQANQMPALVLKLLK
jgi:flagellin-like hook-associated protein FlgL